MQAMPPLDPSSIPEQSLAVSLLIPAKRSGHALENTVIEAHRFLSQRYPGDFEIVLIPNPDPGDPTDVSIEISEALARRFAEVVVVPHTSPAGKGAAIRTGFFGSRGRWIFMTDADLPYDLEFFDRAANKLRSGYDFVTGNRRLPASVFDVPMDMLSHAYKRHRLGIWFNRVVRFILPICTIDTQSGLKAFTRELAVLAFSIQICPGFFFDLELFLASYGHGFHHVDIPATLYLNSQESTVWILRESILAVFWLSKITCRQWRGVYGRHSVRKSKILKRFRGSPIGTRLFLLFRWHLTPYDIMASRMPPKGKVMDLGCGHGLLTLAIALSNADRQVLGVDHDAMRIETASRAVRELTNITFLKGSMLAYPEAGPFAGIALIDCMHYFNPESQEKIIRDAYKHLEPGGTLLIREVDPKGGVIASWNRLYEKIATRIGFTRTDEKGLFFRTPIEWEYFIEKTGFKVATEPCSSALFSDILFVCERSRK